MSSKLSKKDKSLILLVVSGFTLLWLVYSIGSAIYTSVGFKNSDLNQKLFAPAPNESDWLNTSQALTPTDLKKRLILLDFLQYNCLDCAASQSEIKKLEEEFRSKLTVISVASGQNSDRETIQKIAFRYDIAHPILIDGNESLRKKFEVNAWPSFVLINPNGKISAKFEGNQSIPQLKSLIRKLINSYGYQINRSPLPVALEKYKLAENVLNFPTKLEYASNFEYKSRRSPVIFIADSGNNSIVVTSLTGEIIVRIGSKKPGFQDGSFANALFNSPTGLAYHNGILYVCDTVNNLIRKIDFKEGKVSTVLGSGESAKPLKAEAMEAKNVSLSSPYDIEFFPDFSNLVISSNNQLLKFNLDNQTVTVFAGSGEAGMKDGLYPENSLAQTSDLKAYEGKLYLLDAQSSSLRVIDADGNLTTLIGQGIDRLGHKNGDKTEALMNYPLGMTIDDTGIYITDSLNSRLRRFSKNKLVDFAGTDKKGASLGSAVEFNEPEGIIAVMDRFYIADSVNNRIVILNRDDFTSELLNVMPQQKFPKEGFLEYFATPAPSIKIKAASETELKINLRKGWKINEQGPSFLNLLAIDDKNQAQILLNIDWKAIIKSINNVAIALPRLEDGKKYVVQGLIYYCEDKKNALCYVKNYEQKIEASVSENKTTIEVEL